MGLKCKIMNKKKILFSWPRISTFFYLIDTDRHNLANMLVIAAHFHFAEIQSEQVWLKDRHCSAGNIFVVHIVNTQTQSLRHRRATLTVWMKLISHMILQHAHIHTHTQSMTSTTSGVTNSECLTPKE